MFDISLGELAMIGAVALICLDQDKARHALRKAGYWYGAFLQFQSKLNMQAQSIVQMSQAGLNEARAAIGDGLGHEGRSCALQGLPELPKEFSGQQRQACVFGKFRPCKPRLKWARPENKFRRKKLRKHRV